MKSVKHFSLREQGSVNCVGELFVVVRRDIGEDLRRRGLFGEDVAAMRRSLDVKRVPPAGTCLLSPARCKVKR